MAVVLRQKLLENRFSRSYYHVGRAIDAAGAPAPLAAYASASRHRSFDHEVPHPSFGMSRAISGGAIR
jgi:hypothetical protein